MRRSKIILRLKLLQELSAAQFAKNLLLSGKEQGLGPGER
jgi:hypothetical protein